MDSIRVSIIQTDIVWENKQENLRLLHEKLQSLRGITEIVVLPEMFSTGFSMQSQTLAEPNSGKTISTLKQWASLFQLAICGSYIATDNGQFYNRPKCVARITRPTGVILSSCFLASCAPCSSESIRILLNFMILNTLPFKVRRSCL